MRRSISAFAAAATVALASHAADAQTVPSQDSAPIVRNEAHSALAPGQARLSDLLAGDLQSSDGNEIGEVEDVILEGSRIVAVIVRVEQDLGLGERSVSVPFDAVRRDGDRLILNLTAEQVRALPAIESAPQNDEPRR